MALGRSSAAETPPPRGFGPGLGRSVEPHADQPAVPVHAVDLVAGELELVDDRGRVRDAALAQLGEADGPVPGVAQRADHHVLAAVGEVPCAHARIVAARGPAPGGPPRTVARLSG